MIPIVFLFELHALNDNALAIKAIEAKIVFNSFFILNILLS
jgi:hypothetical protein